MPEALRRQPVLDDGATITLTRYGATIEHIYGSPQDIEWALANGEFFIVQTRPITALPEPMAGRHVVEKAEAELEGRVDFPLGTTRRNP